MSYRHTYRLPSNNGVERGTFPAGTVKATVIGFTKGSILVETWDGSAWTTAATILPAVSGLIGATSITIPASGRVRATLSGHTEPCSPRLRLFT